MNRFLIICLTVFGMSTQAQKCKWSLDKIDPFSNERIKQSEGAFIFKPKGISFLPSVVIAFKMVNERKMILISYSSSQPFVIPEGAKVMIKLEDGSILEYESTRSIVADFAAVPIPNSVSMHTYSAVVESPISQEELLKLSNTMVSAVRINTSSGFIDYKAIEKHAKKLLPIAKCIL